MRTVVLTLILLISLQVFAQDVERISFQFDAGPTLAFPYKKTIDLSDGPGFPTVKNYKPSTGGFFEMLLVDSVNRSLSICTGLNFSVNRLSTNSTIGYTEYNGTRMSLMFTVPVIFNFKLSKSFPLNAGLGGYLALPLSLEESGTFLIDTSQFTPIDPNDPALHNFDPSGNYDWDLKDDHKGLDIGLIFQLQYDICISPKLSSVVFSRFNYGIVNALKQESSYVWRNYSALLGIGLKIKD